MSGPTQHELWPKPTRLDLWSDLTRLNLCHGLLRSTFDPNRLGSESSCLNLWQVPTRLEIWPRPTQLDLQPESTRLKAILPRPLDWVGSYLTFDLSLTRLDLRIRSTLHDLRPRPNSAQPSVCGRLVSIFNPRLDLLPE